MTRPKPLPERGFRRFQDCTSFWRNLLFRREHRARINAAEEARGSRSTLENTRDWPQSGRGTIDAYQLFEPADQESIPWLMKLIQPNCRIQFTADDLQFITDTLAHTAGDRNVLVELLGDAETRDVILDDEKLFNALLEHRGCLRVSNRLYFFIIVRNVLKRADIDDRDVADYIAELLAEYSDFEQTRCRVKGQEAALDYFFEMLAALQNADERTSFYIRAHIGNHSLFLSGIFPRRIRYRAEQRGFPDLRYYESLGRANYRIASDHRLASRYDLGPIYATLSERFQSARIALNDMSERLVSLGDMDAGIDAFLLNALKTSAWS